MLSLKCSQNEHQILTIDFRRIKFDKHIKVTNKTNSLIGEILPQLTQNA